MREIVLITIVLSVYCLFGGCFFRDPCPVTDGLDKKRKHGSVFPRFLYLYFTDYGLSGKMPIRLCSGQALTYLSSVPCLSSIWCL
jgi:hypothetical protein